LEIGRRYTTWFHDGKIDSLWQKFSNPMRDVFQGNVANLRQFRDGVEKDFGPEKSLVSEMVNDRDGAHEYVRVAKVAKGRVPLRIKITFDDDGTIAGMVVGANESTTADFSAYRTKTALRLPFNGPWLVFWGGRTKEQNYHVATVDQHYACDFQVRKDGRSHTGDGSKREQYYCFGLPILAPGAGVVVKVVADVADQVPGKMDPAHAPGNYVVIDHGNGEFSFLCHLRQRSAKVKEGQKVNAGDELAACGNSGNTSEPHLHYHLQTTPDFGRGDGLPAQFRSYVVDRGEPAKGQVIQTESK
jgi:hypothetical protein